MPRHVVDLIAEALNDRGRALSGAKVGILGVAFKPNVQDARNSPAADVIALTAARGAEVAYHDPHVAAFTDVTGVERENRRPGRRCWAGPTRSSCSSATGRSTGSASTATARLVVDTVNSSRDRPTRERQVLRLGRRLVERGLTRRRPPARRS